MIEALTAVMDRISKTDCTVHLLKALPLVHLLRGDCGPCEQIVVRPSAIEWTTPGVKLGTIRNKMDFKKGCVCISMF